MPESVLKIGSEVPKENRIGMKAADYGGGKSTLCAGCGHDAVSNQIIRAFYEMNVKPESVAKFSGIGCSSKTPAYFVESAHGFNGVHGRMPALTTGAQLANHRLIMLGVSGDGDTASIGLGQFMHMIRRNVDCTYIIEDNGTYGLTKGQFSATADLGSVQKKGAVNTFQPIDPCAVALALGCSSKTPAYFVESAHGFNGVHGRMPSLTTGAQLANRQLI
ncbi:MAG TPA: thiamine pyrophosphate-dependent enzyme, partial [Thermoanaerobaculia bacterium]